MDIRRCSFCGRTEAKVHEATGVGLIAGNHGAFRSPEASDAYICRECAELAVEILTGNAGG